MIDTDKAYLLGIIIGGGCFESGLFHIKLPYKGWGDVKDNPERAGQIGKDILNVLKPMFKQVYGVDISFSVLKNYWSIDVYGDTKKIQEDLIRYNIDPYGELRKNIQLDTIRGALNSKELKKRFITGLADAIGSTSASHRRYTNDTQIISFELNTFDFKNISILCGMLHEIGCYPDQILWNHPNCHSAQDSLYEPWKKGMKIRVKIDQYSKFGKFDFTSKTKSAIENQKLESKKTDACPCFNSVIKPKISCVHPGENDSKLPDVIRGGHYLHNKHYCAVLGCKYAPYDKIEALINRAGELICPFPLIHKSNDLHEIKQIIYSKEIYKDRTYSAKNMLLSDLRNQSTMFKNLNNENEGYPISSMLQGIAFIIGNKLGNLNGKRVRGNYLDLIDKYLKDNPEYVFSLYIPEIHTPLIITDGESAAMIAPLCPSVYSKLVVKDPNIPYKIKIREIRREDYEF